MTLHVGDCREVMAGMDAESVDAVVTDPPYGLEFMGKEWDTLGDVRQRGDATFDEADAAEPFGRVRHGGTAAYSSGLPAAHAMQAWHESWAVEALRVLKPGGHLLAFGGTRTYHRLVCAVEDAGFEIRDTIAWLYGSGFPKSLNLSGEWEGWGTALKPAHEPIVVARKPLVGTVAANVSEHGVGGLNIDDCRIGTGGHLQWSAPRDMGYHGGTDGEAEALEAAAGRWPANVVLDEEAAAILDQQTGELPRATSRTNPEDRDVGLFGFGGKVGVVHPDSGGASRFFYVAKAGREERNAGLNGMEERPTVTAAGSADRCRLCGRQRVNMPGSECLCDEPEWEKRATHTAAANHHPTVKPIDLMRWLVRLVTPPNGLILDPFTGSGTTGIAAGLEGFDFVGIEQDPEYAKIAEARMAHWKQLGHQPSLL